MRDADPWCASADYTLNHARHSSDRDPLNILPGAPHLAFEMWDTMPAHRNIAEHEATDNVTHNPQPTTTPKPRKESPTNHSTQTISGTALKNPPQPWRNLSPAASAEKCATSWLLQPTTTFPQAKTPPKRAKNVPKTTQNAPPRAATIWKPKRKPDMSGSRRRRRGWWWI